MQIVAYNKCSMIDYDGKLSAVIFTGRCNMNCPYCHNKGLLNLKASVDERGVLNHLENRKHLLDGLVISGGEPTLEVDIIPFIRRIKALGYQIKLDTNGTNPQLLKQLIDAEFIDYVAMDIKTIPDKYPEICGLTFEQVSASIALLRAFGHFEFRTTVYPMITLDDLELLCKTYQDDSYILQQYRPNTDSDLKTYEDELLMEIAKKYDVGIRGVSFF